MATRKKPAEPKANVLGIAMPDTLPPSMRPEFDSLINHMAGRPGGVVVDEDLASIEALMFHRYVMREAFASILENGTIIDGKHNPSVTAMPSHASSIVKIAALLNLGPAARARLKTPPATSAKAKPTPWDSADE